MSFEQLAALMQEYRARAAPDGYSQFVATGLAYVDYALAHRARFQLMFRSDRLEQGNERLVAAGDRAYAHLRETMELVTTQAKVRSASLEPKIALAWSMVHGFATLMLDRRGVRAPPRPAKPGACFTGSDLRGDHAIASALPRRDRRARGASEHVSEDLARRATRLSPPPR